MAFSNNIQTGTDNNLAGYDGNGATASSHGGRIRYETSGLLTVRGTLTINVMDEYLSGSTQMIRVESGGHLIINAVTSLSEAETTTYSDYVAIQTTYNNDSDKGAYSATHAIIDIDSGGQITWNGGAIKGACPIQFDDGSIVRINSGVWDAEDFFNTYPCMIRCYTSDYAISGLRLLRGGAFVLMKATAHDAPEIMYENAYGIGMSGSMSTDVIPYGYLSAINPKGMLGFWSGRVIWAKAGSADGNYNLVGYSAAWSANNKGRVYCSVPITLDGGEGAQFYIPNFNVRGIRQNNWFDNFTDAAGLVVGNNATTNLPLFVGRRGSGGAQGTNDEGANQKDYFCKDPENTLGLRDIYGYRYGYRPIYMEIQTYGTDALNPDVNFVIDENITEPDKSIVDAYTEINTLNQLYDALSAYKVSNLTVGGVENTLITANGTTLTVLDGWTLALDDSQTDIIAVDGNTITVKASSLNGSTTFDILTGLLDNSINGDIQFLKPNGKVNITIAVTENSNIQSPVIGVWPQSQGLTDRAGIVTASVTNGTATIADLEPNTDYYLACDGVGANRQISEFNTGDFGDAPAVIELQRIIQANGSAILPATLTADQRRIADMFIYSVSDGRVDIKLPDDYASDSRWNASNSIWRFSNDDFISIAYRIEELQSSAAFLAVSTTILIEQFKLTLKADSTFSMRQHLDNVDCLINMTAFTIVREGDDTQDKTYLDHTNGVINTNAGNPVVATLSTPSNVLEAVTNQIPAKVNEATDIQTILTNTENPVALPENLASAANVIVAMTANNQFTAAALANAPTSTGSSSGTSSGGLTAEQNGALTAINQATIAHSYSLTEALEQGAISIPISDAFTDGYFTGHYIVITDGAHNVAQRAIVAHTNLTTPPSPQNPQGAPMTALTLSEGVNAFGAGAQVHILIRTVAQDAPDIEGLQAGVTEARDHARAANVQTQR